MKVKKYLNLEKEAKGSDYIVVAMSYSLDDQTSHAKVFSSHCYEQ
jgi:hypothetical protein